MREASDPVGDAVVRLELELEIECDIEPIRGRLRIADQPAREFVGMLELMALLDAVRGGQPPEPG